MRVAPISTAALLSLLLMGTGAAQTVCNDAANKAVAASEGGEGQLWLKQNYSPILASALPLRAFSTGQLPDDVRWALTVRILPPFDEAEYWVSMQRKYDGSVEAVVRSPEGLSIVCQLEKLKQQFPGASREEITNQLAIRTRLVTDKQEHRLRKLADQLEAMRWSPVLPDTLFMDGTVYELVSESQYGNRLQLSVTGPGPNANKQAHSLIKWVEKMRSTLREHVQP